MKTLNQQELNEWIEQFITDCKPLLSKKQKDDILNAFRNCAKKSEISEEEWIKGYKEKKSDKY